MRLQTTFPPKCLTRKQICNARIIWCGVTGDIEIIDCRDVTTCSIDLSALTLSQADTVIFAAVIRDDGPTVRFFSRGKRTPPLDAWRRAFEARVFLQSLLALHRSRKVAND